MIDNNVAMDPTRKCIGIDLGTTNTAVAISRVDINGQIILEDQEIGQKGDNSIRKREVLPSIVYFKENGRIAVGAEAEELKNEISSKDETIRYVENSKRDIGKQRVYTIDDKKYSPTDIAQIILQYAVSHSRAKQVLSDAYVCVTVPANFDTDQIEATATAAKKAGLGKVRLFPEPKAAILSYVHSEMSKRDEDKCLNLKEKKRILVIDIGGGTCDICIEDVLWKNNSLKFDSIGVPNRENIGGVDFDIRIAEYLKNKYLNDVDLTHQDHIELMKAARAAKEKLSANISWYIEEENYSSKAEVYENSNWIDEISSADDWKLNTTVNGETIRFYLTVNEFINIIKPLVKSSGLKALNKDEKEKNKNVEELIISMLQESNIDSSSIDYVFLTGGMAKCFPVEAMLYELLKRPIIVPDEPYLAVSRGAALLNKYPELEEESNDKMSRSIMMEMADGSLLTLIKAGEAVPVAKKVDYTFKTKSQNGVEIRLFEGKNEYDWQLRKLNHVYTIKFRTPKAVGRPFTVFYDINKSKQIKFEIVFQDNNEKYTIESAIMEEQL